MEVATGVFFSGIFAALVLSVAGLLFLSAVYVTAFVVCVVRDVRGGAAQIPPRRPQKPQEPH
jgi:hypothetical protein